MANIVPSQKLNRAAVLNLFMVLTLLLCASVIGILFILNRS